MFRDSIAATGLSIFDLYSFSLTAVLFPSFSFMVINEIGVERSTASNTEHRNERDNAPNKYSKISNIVYECIIVENLMK